MGAPKFPGCRQDSLQRSCQEQLIPPGMLPPPPDDSGAGSSPFPVLSVSRDKPGISSQVLTVFAEPLSPPCSRGVSRESNHSIPEAFSLSSGQTRPSQPTPGFFFFAGVQYLWSSLEKHWEHRARLGLSREKPWKRVGGGEGIPSYHPVGLVMEKANPMGTTLLGADLVIFMDPFQFEIPCEILEWFGLERP